ncbi:MAG: DUF3667 domain-containing protein [Pseudomonadota bacterium]
MLEFFDLDGRLLTTLRLLLTRPGALSVEFSADRRAAYTAPLRLCIATGLLFFFVAGLFAVPEETVSEVDVTVGDSPSADVSAAPLTAAELAAIAPYLEAAEMARLETRAARHTDTRLVLRDLIVEMRAAQDDGMFSPLLLRLTLPSLVQLLVAPDVFIGRLNEKLPFAMLLLLPAYAGVLWLLFRSASRYYVEHLVFALHVHAFGFIVLSIGALAPARFGALAALASLAALLATGLYVLLAMRTYYAAGWYACGWRWLTAGTFYLLMLAPALLFVLALTILPGFG